MGIIGFHSNRARKTINFLGYIPIIGSAIAIGRAFAALGGRTLAVKLFSKIKGEKEFVIPEKSNAKREWKARQLKLSAIEVVPFVKIIARSIPGTCSNAVKRWEQSSYSETAVGQLYKSEELSAELDESKNRED